MIRADGDLPVVYLKAGEMHFAEVPTLVVTVLGSCLSVTMHSPRHRIGGICHGLLPVCGGSKACSGSCLEGFKYVDCSIEQMARLFDKAGVKRSAVEVKYFGGADMFSRIIGRPGAVSVGSQNILAAQKMLKREGFSIVNHDAGGLRGRKILFYTHTGDVFLKRLTKVSDPDIRW